MRINKAGQPVPWLASVFKEDAKAQTITLTLRKEVKFHDGTDFNAQAVKWNLDQHISAKTAGTEKIKSVDIVDTSTVRITLTTWDSTFVGNLSQFLGMIVSPAAVNKNGAEWAEKNPVGTGPFQFVSWEKDVRTSYKKFPGYWQKGKPYLDTIEYGVISDAMTREFSLKKGETDAAIRLAPKSLAALEREGFVINRVRGASGAVSLVPDSGNPNSPFANVKVRQALAHAVDTNTIVKTVYLGEAEVANQQIYKGNWAYNPGIVGYPYNPAKAKQLLKEAGYPNGFKTKLLHYSTADHDQFFTAVQGYLKEVGIDVELDPATSARQNQVNRQGAKWEGLAHAQPSGNPDVVVHMSTMYMGSMTQMTVPEDYASAVREAITAPDAKSKTKAIQTAMKLMIDKYALVFPLYFMPDFIPVNKKVHNHGLLSSPNIGLWTPEDVWMEKK